MTDPSFPAAGANAAREAQIRRRNRWALIGIVAIFIVPILLATLLNFTGHRPAPTKQHGELLDPRPDLRALSPTLANGEPYRWNPSARLWRIVLAPPPACSVECERLGHELDTVWQLFGKDADHVDVLWIGTPPASARAITTLRTLRADPSLRAMLPGVNDLGVDQRGVPVYVVDPYGFVVLRYPPGFDPAGLRADMAKLLKLN